ncbi:hypothetical protein M0R45_030133 [Rubus argutus]|uniref:Uncharacterized protein n=1 Tax=Rubus argutus TaxID=59490 RepID=A0AAW1WE55_RUBAR
MIFVKYAQIMDTQLRYVLRNLPWMLEVVHFRGGLLIDLGCKTVVLGCKWPGFDADLEVVSTGFSIGGCDGRVRALYLVLFMAEVP